MCLSILFQALCPLAVTIRSTRVAFVIKTGKLHAIAAFFAKISLFIRAEGFLRLRLGAIFFQENIHLALLLHNSTQFT